MGLTTKPKFKLLFHRWTEKGRGFSAFLQPATRVQSDNVKRGSNHALLFYQLHITNEISISLQTIEMQKQNKINNNKNSEIIIVAAVIISVQ